ncbi:MAG TPA: hypothetical protein VMU89_16690, partial [Thermomicrobiaceae bacterium]|nr:hypothetical protein [Thermomicrobiaceae bacterium]
RRMMSWQAGIRGPASIGEPLGFQIRQSSPSSPNQYDPLSGVVVETRLTEEAAGLLLAAAEWACVEFDPGLCDEPEGNALLTTRLELEHALATSGDSGLVELLLGTGQIAILASAATLCAQLGGLDPFLVSEMIAGARSLEAAAAMGPVAREMGLICRDRMSSAPFSVN